MLSASKQKWSGGGFVAFGLIWCSLLPAQTLRVVAGPVPAGALAQLRVELDRPLAVARGTFTVSLPEAFGPIADVQVFSAAGDAAGTAKIMGRRAEVSFVSYGSGVGRLKGMPVATVTVPLLATGGSSEVRVEAAGWQDSAGHALAVAGSVGTVPVGGSLAIEHVVPLGNDAYRLVGRGFGPNLRLTADGLAVRSVEFVSATELTLTLAGAAELTGRRLVVRNPSGESAEFVYALETTLVGESAESERVLVPMRLRSGANLGFAPRVPNGWAGVAIENPNPVPVDLTVESFTNLPYQGRRTLWRLPPFGRLFRSLAAVGVPELGTGGMVASLPVRVALVARVRDFLSAAYPGLQVSSPGPFAGFRLPAQPFVFIPQPMLFVVRMGELPPPQELPLRLERVMDPVTVSLRTDVPWLVVPPTSAVLYSSSVRVSVKPEGLAPGEWHGTITLTTSAPDVRVQTVPVTLSVRAQPFITADSVYLTAPYLGDAQEVLLPIYFDTTAPSAPVTISAQVKEGGEWITVLNPSSTTADPVRLRIDPSRFAEGWYTGTVSVAAASNTAEVNVTLAVSKRMAPPAGFAPKELSLQFRAGNTAMIDRVPVAVGWEAPYSISVSTESGGNWLGADLAPGGSLGVSVDARRLPLGVYRGKVIASLTGTAKVAELPVRITLTAGVANPLQVLPGVFEFDAPEGGFGVLLEQESLIPLRASVATQPEGCVMNAEIRNAVRPQAGTPATVTVSCQGPPGRYRGVIRVTADEAEVLVPVSFTIPSVPLNPLVYTPAILAVTSGAANATGPVAAESVVTLHGIGKGLAVSFDEWPAVVLSSTELQTSVVVPEGVAGRPMTTVRAGGVAATVEVVAQRPGLFTLDGSGVGQGAVVNQDGLVNGVDHPATVGSVVQIYGTGVHGPVRVTIGGVAAEVLYSGTVGLGLVQINAVVPGGVSGVVPVRVTSGGAGSQEGVTVVVE